MKYAIIEASGKQFWAESGRFIELNQIQQESGTQLLFNRILFARNHDSVFIGQPYLEKIKIEAVVDSNILGPKIMVYKMKPKKKYRKKIGYRQKLTRIFIETIIY